MGTAETDSQLGSNAAELQRLILQGRVLAPATRTIFVAAGICSGMRVLDLGPEREMPHASPPNWSGQPARSATSTTRPPAGLGRLNTGEWVGYVRARSRPLRRGPWDDRIWRPPS